MDTPPPIPPVIEQRIPQQHSLRRRYTIARLFLELFLASIVGMLAFISPAWFLADRPSNYEHAVFIPVVGEMLEEPTLCSFLLMLAVALAVGVLGRAPVWLTGPGIMLGFPVWALIDAIAGGGGHNLLPFEILAYVAGSAVFIGPAVVGRYATPWGRRNAIPQDA